MYLLSVQLCEEHLRFDGFSAEVTPSSATTFLAAIAESRVVIKRKSIAIDRLTNRVQDQNNYLPRSVTVRMTQYGTFYAYWIMSTIRPSSRTKSILLHCYSIDITDMIINREHPQGAFWSA